MVSFYIRDVTFINSSKSAFAGSRQVTIFYLTLLLFYG